MQLANDLGHTTFVSQVVAKCYSCHQTYDSSPVFAQFLIALEKMIMSNLIAFRINYALPFCRLHVPKSDSVFSTPSSHRWQWSHQRCHLDAARQEFCLQEQNILNHGLQIVVIIIFSPSGYICKNQSGLLFRLMLTTSCGRFLARATSLALWA